MKIAKKLLAMTLAVCMLIGVPLSIDVAATGDPKDTTLRLVQAMMIPEHWEDTSLDRNTQVALYFTGHVRTVNASQIKAYIGIVGANSWNYDASIRHYTSGGNDVFDRLSFSGTLSEKTTDPALLGETNAYGTANTNQWIFTMNPNSANNMNKEANIAPQYQHLVEGDKVDTIPEMFALAKAAGKRLAVVIVDNGSRGETLNNMIGRTANGGSPTVPLTADTQKANIDHGNNNGTDANGKARAGAHAIVYDETTAARMTGATLDNITKTLTVNFSEPMTVRKGVMSGLMVLNSQGQLMAQKAGAFAVHPTADYGVMFNSNAYPLTITSGEASGTVALDATAYNRIINWQKMVDTHNATYPEDPLRVLFYIGEESTGTDTTYSWRGEAKSNYYMDSLYTADLRPFMANYKKNAQAGLNDFMVTEISVTNYVALANGKGYDTLDAALAAATEGQTVTLYNDVTVENINISGGVTLDLNGKTLTAESVFAITEHGYLVDSTEGGALIKIAKNDEENQYLKMSTINPMMPLYDCAAGGYRLFTIEMEHIVRDGETADSVKFGFRVNMAAAGYNLLNDAANADVELIANLVITVDGEELLVKDYAFKAETLAEYAAKKALNDGKNWTVVLTISGLTKVNGTVVITSTPRVESSTGVLVLADAIVK